jgi:acetyl-CoA carboxylase carboxyl transferase subunit alpha
MKITAQDLLDMKVIDGVIPEPLGGAHRGAEAVIEATGERIASALKDMKQSNADFREQRREKFLAIGRSL